MKWLKIFFSKTQDLEKKLKTDYVVLAKFSLQDEEEWQHAENCLLLAVEESGWGG